MHLIIYIEIQEAKTNSTIKVICKFAYDLLIFFALKLTFFPPLFFFLLGPTKALKI